MSENSHKKSGVKRFVAKTMSRALELVRQELGPEAVILSSRRVPEGVEVLTSLQPDFSSEGLEKRRDFERRFDTEQDQVFSSDSAWKSQSLLDDTASQWAAHGATTHPKPSSALSGSHRRDLAEEIEVAREKMLLAKKAEARVEGDFSQRSAVGQSRQLHSASDEAFSKRSEISALKTEIADLKLLLEQRFTPDSDSLSLASSESYDLHESHRERQREQALAYTSDHSFTQNTGTFSERKKMNIVEDKLLGMGLSRPTIRRLMVASQKIDSPSRQLKACINQLEKTIPCSSDDPVRDGGVFAFIGQTGVGKTTTIAKLAARYLMREGAGSVAIVSLDSYRVGATEQLKTVSKILRVPLKTLSMDDSSSPEGIREYVIRLNTLLAELKEFSLVLIDTAGCRMGDQLMVQQLGVLREIPIIKKFFVVASNSQHQTMRASYHAYGSKLKLDGCILTKIDETASLGDALSILSEQAAPLVYMTNGQTIPTDLHVADSHVLVSSAVELSEMRDFDVNRMKGS